ncbi:DUF397 domain-containing protein [Lentzea alba]
MRELHWKNASPEQSACTDLAIESAAGFVRDSKNVPGPVIEPSPYAFASFIKYAGMFPGQSPEAG